MYTELTFLQCLAVLQWTSLHIVSPCASDSGSLVTAGLHAARYADFVHSQLQDLLVMPSQPGVPHAQANGLH